jgi:hypothetical protein
LGFWLAFKRRHGCCVLPGFWIPPEQEKSLIKQRKEFVPVYHCRTKRDPDLCPVTKVDAGQCFSGRDNVCGSKRQPSAA